MTAATVPDGFVEHGRPSAVTDPWEPIYRNTNHQAVSLAILIRPPHCNGRGFLHGGVITCLADNAMGLSVARELRRANDSPDARGYTLGLNIDFVRRANVGDWVEFRPIVRKAGRTISLVDCEVIANDTDLVARAGATFISDRSD